MGPQQQLAKIHQPALIAQRLVLAVDLQHGRGEVIPRILLDMLRPQPLILLAVDKPLRLFRRPATLVNLVLPHHPLDQPQLVIAVQDLEIFRQAGILPVRAQQPVSNTVESTKPHPAGRQVHHLLDPVAHLLGRLVGKGHRQDARRRYLIHLHQPRHPVHQHPGLATAGPGQHQ